MPEASADHARVEAMLQPLDPRTVWLWRLSLAVRSLGFAVAVFVLSRLRDGWFAALPLAVGILVLGLVLAAFWPPVRYRCWGFRLRDDDLFVRRGVLWRTTSVIPHVRIQHVDMRQGPIERWLGLASVVVFTAGIRGAELSIPGLAVPEAEALRERLSTLGGRGGDAV